METRNISVKKEIRSYQDLEIWQNGVRLTEDIYRVTRTFPKEETYGLTSQIRRAVVSVAANVAEGYARNHKNEFRQFLYIALGLLAEVETLWVISSRLGFIPPALRQDHFPTEQTLKLRYQILALLKRL